MTRARRTAAWLLFTALPGPPAFGQQPSAGDSPADAQAASVSERITVTATASPNEVGDVAGGVSVVAREEIESLQMHDARDLLVFEPGVYVANSPTRLGLGGFVVRGIGGNRVQTQIDGIPTPEEFSFGPLAAPRAMLGVEALQSAEIVRGPASSLYGSDALGGVVSLVTREPGDYLGGRSLFWGATAAYDGTSDETLASGTFAAGGDRWRGSLHLQGSEGHETESHGERATQDPLRTAANPQDRDTSGALAKLNLDLGERADLRLAFEGARTRTLTEAYSQRVPVIGIPTLDYDAEDAVRRARGSAAVLAQLGGALADTLYVRAYYQDALTEQDTAEVRLRASGATDRVSSFDFEQQTLGGELQAHKALSAAGAHLLTYGGSWSDKRFDLLRRQVEIGRASGAALPSPMRFPTKYFPESRVEQLGVFVQDEIDVLGGRLRLVPGVRYDRAELRPDREDPIFLSGNPGTPAPEGAVDEAVSPKLGVVFAASDSLSLTAQYARGFRTPPYSDVNQGFTNVALGYTTLPNPELEPEASDTWELGARGRVGRASWSLNAFESRYSDFIELATVGVDPATRLLQFQSRNVARARIRGVELGADGALASRWRWRLAGAWTEGDELSTGQPLGAIAPPALTAGLFYGGAGRLDAAVVTRRLFAKESDEVDRSAVDQLATPAATVVDVSVGWELSPALSVRAGIENALDETYWQWGDVQGLAAASPVLERYSSPPRSFVATLRWSR